MDYTSIVISLLSGIALFLFGMSTLSDGLEQISGGRLEAILERMTGSVLRGVIFGAIVTALIQSSTATTVMCVGFVNAGVMKFRQAVGVIMGANIGTTATAWIIALGDVESKGIFAFLNPSFLGPLCAFIGIVFYMFLNKGKKKALGQILVGFGMLFIGIKGMESAVAPLAELPAFRDLFSSFTNPVLGILVGAVVTIIIQSSSASVGILQAIASTGALTFNAALPIIMGQNIGTTATAIISSIGASKNAKRTGVVHFIFNVAGTFLFSVAIYALNAAIQFAFWDMSVDRTGIATIHLIFNLSTTVALLPFHKLLVRFVEKLIPADESEREVTVLDPRFLATPSLALEMARAASLQMGIYARENYNMAMSLFSEFDPKKVERINETENAIDRMENNIENYLVQLTSRALSIEESTELSELLHVSSDFERIGDYAVNIAESASVMHAEGMIFSGGAKAELVQLHLAIEDVLDKTMRCYEERSVEVALKVEPLEEVVDLMRDVLRTRHVERLKEGTCTIEVGTQFLEMLNNLERISDHCSNVALTVVRRVAHEGDVILEDVHEYTERLHRGENRDFITMYEGYKEKYYAPIQEAKQP